jgi:hypothetical protein
MNGLSAIIDHFKSDCRLEIGDVRGVDLQQSKAGAIE